MSDLSETTQTRERCIAAASANWIVSISDDPDTEIADG